MRPFGRTTRYGKGPARRPLKSSSPLPAEQKRSGPQPWNPSSGVPAAGVPFPARSPFCLPCGSSLGPSRREYLDGSDPPRRWHVSAHQPAPLCRSGRQKGGGDPVHLRFPCSAWPRHHARRNSNGNSRLEENVRAHRKASFVYVRPIVPCALPDRHGTPLFSGHYSPPNNGVSIRCNRRR